MLEFLKPFLYGFLFFFWDFSRDFFTDFNKNSSNNSAGNEYRDSSYFRKHSRDYSGNSCIGFYRNNLRDSFRSSCKISSSYFVDCRVSFRDWSRNFTWNITMDFFPVLVLIFLVVVCLGMLPHWFKCLTPRGVWCTGLGITIEWLLCNVYCTTL